MKRSLLLFLFVALPLQMAWNVAAAYCQHEQGKATQHFGHHAHQHVWLSSDADNDHSSPLSKSHTDCASCHLSPLGIIVFTPPTPAPRLATTAPLEPLSFPHSTHLDRPERPRWVFAT